MAEKIMVNGVDMGAVLDRLSTEGYTIWERDDSKTAPDALLEDIQYKPRRRRMSKKRAEMFKDTWRKIAASGVDIFGDED